MIKLSLTLSSSSKQLKSFHLILWISSARLLIRFDSELVTNLALSKVLARPYLITLYAILRIYLNFPIRSRCVLKAIIHRKKTVDCFTGTWKSSFCKRRFLWYCQCMWYLINFYILSICFYISCFFIYHLSIIFAISRSIHAFFSQYL